MNIPRVFSPSKVLDLIFPRFCVGCERPVDRPGRFLCAACLEALEYEPYAPAALRFEGTARNLVLDYKLHGALWLVPDFVDLLEAVVRTRLDPVAVDAVVPVPLTFWHRLDRGFNQSVVLAKGLARRLARRCETGVLWRTGHPGRQSALDYEARLANARGTFAIRHPERIRSRRLLLVDDILTTGATCQAAREALREAGAARVDILTLARTPSD